MTDAWSITDGYHDVDGHWHATSIETRGALREAMGAGDRDEPPPSPPMWFVRAGESHPLLGRCDLRLEGGDGLDAIDALPPDLPLGYHDLQPLDGGPATRLVVSPMRCPDPTPAWGWSLQLYAMRSAASWGMGDLADLAELNRWASTVGAGAVLVNPLHANAPGEPQQPSPYFATSRLWRNPAYIAIDRVDGADEIPGLLGQLGAIGRALPAATIDRNAVARLKGRALAALFERFEQSPGRGRMFARWRAEQGVALERFATWCALAERHGPAFGSWPGDLQHPASPTVAAFADRSARAVTFHAWCQWVLDSQLAAARHETVQLIGDLAIGFDAQGADAWAEQDLLALGCRVGAPPDAFNARGQDWGLPPFVPWKLRAARYEPFAASLRASFTHLDGLRIDHVMGLFRLYWLPPGGGPNDGAYVRYPASDLLDILSIEAARAAAFVVGEDLGTVEEHVGQMLRDRNVLGCTVFWFEDRAPTDYPEHVLASVTTHDLPTVAGVWTGADRAEQRSIGLVVEDDDILRARLRRHAGIEDDAIADDAIVAVHHALATAPSTLVLASLDDALAVERRPNLPGTVDERPNWRLPLPVRLDELEAHPLVARVAAAMRHGRAQQAARATDDDGRDAGGAQG